MLNQQGIVFCELHNAQDIKSICLNKLCQEDQRLVCYDCVLNDHHQGHWKEFLDISKAENWSNSQIDKFHKLVADINAIQKQIVSKFEEILSQLFEKNFTYEQQLRSMQNPQFGNSIFRLVDLDDTVKTIDSKVKPQFESLINVLQTSINELKIDPSKQSEGIKVSINLKQEDEKEIKYDVIVNPETSFDKFAHQVKQMNFSNLIDDDTHFYEYNFIEKKEEQSISIMKPIDELAKNSLKDLGFINNSNLQIKQSSKTVKQYFGEIIELELILLVGQQILKKKIQVSTQIKFNQLLKEMKDCYIFHIFHKDTVKDMEFIHLIKGKIAEKLDENDAQPLYDLCFDQNSILKIIVHS